MNDNERRVYDREYISTRLSGRVTGGLGLAADQVALETGANLYPT